MYYLFNMKTGESEGQFEEREDRTRIEAAKLAGECLGDWILDGICDSDNPDDYGLYILSVRNLRDVKFHLAETATAKMRKVCAEYIETYKDRDDWETVVQ